MTGSSITSIAIGDIVRQEDNDMPSVVTQVRGALQLSSFIISEQEGDWRLALSGTYNGPVERLGSISVATVAEGFSRSVGDPIGGEYYSKVLKWLEKEAAEGPVSVPNLAK
jgi:hypothetical protein